METLITLHTHVAGQEEQWATTMVNPDCILYIKDCGQTTELGLSSGKSFTVKETLETILNLLNKAFGNTE